MTAHRGDMSSVPCVCRIPETQTHSRICHSGCATSRHPDNCANVRNVQILSGCTWWFIVLRQEVVPFTSRTQLFLLVLLPNRERPLCGATDLGPRL